MNLQTDHVDYILQFINVLGLFSFAVSGAVAALKRKADLIGVLILSLVASTCGGILRDIFIGDLPPAVMRSYLPLFMATLTGITTYFFYTTIMRLSHPIDFFDAIGIGMYTVVGADKALSFGIDPVWSVGMGVVTAVGGGAIRDVLLARVPTILRSEIYVTPAFIGAAIMVAGREWLPGDNRYYMVAGAIACTSLRLLAIRYKWNIRKN